MRDFSPAGRHFKLRTPMPVDPVVDEQLHSLLDGRARYKADQTPDPTTHQARMKRPVPTLPKGPIRW